MKQMIALLLFFITAAAFSQSAAEKEVKQTIEKFFDGFHRVDTLGMKATLHDQLILQTVFRNREGEAMLQQESPEAFLKAVAERPADQKWEERLLDFVIKVDGSMAHAWTPYEFWFNGTFHHCGVNSFQLFKEGSTWKIIYIIDTRRKEGCRQ